jgi:formate dehydrogenase subunit delta
MSSYDHLIQMANDIGNFFRSEPKREDAIAGISNHIDKFWTPRMRQKIAAHLDAHGAESLDELPRAALERLLARPLTSKPGEPPGGDAG